MSTRQSRQRSLVVVATLILALSASSVAMAQGVLIPLPACGVDPNANTRVLQQAIDTAAPGSTLVLPPGECVVARCDLVPGAVCLGAARHARNSALNFGNTSDLTLLGAADGTSVLKLDPNPPRASNGYHAYCDDTHVLSIRGSSYITLRGFTIDGSRGDLPDDTNQCPIIRVVDTGQITERMFDVYVLNSTDVTIDHMKLMEAHGDGLYLLGDRISRTERVFLTNSEVANNKRVGIAFQRNVGLVTISGNYFTDRGNNRLLHMEPTGQAADVGPYEIDIDSNVFDRGVGAPVGVSLGSTGGGIQRSSGIRFTNNRILPASSGGEGGCISVHQANDTTIANNTVIGSSDCVTVTARIIAGLRIEGNRLEGHSYLQHGGNSEGVIFVSEHHVQPGGDGTPYFIYYPTRITITGNTIIQHVRNSAGITLNNADAIVVADNEILHTHRVAPTGPLITVPRAESINLLLGVANDNGRPLCTSRTCLNEKTHFRAWSIAGNRLGEFDDGVRIKSIKADLVLGRAQVARNLFTTTQDSPRGIWVVGPPTSAQSGFIDHLAVNDNAFGCGFTPWLPLLHQRPPDNVFVRPRHQTFTGNVGGPVPCQPPTIKPDPTGSLLLP